MAVDPVSGASGAQTQSASAAAANRASLDYDSFLQLLIAEMRNQDRPSDRFDRVCRPAGDLLAGRADHPDHARLEIELLKSSSISQAGSAGSAAP